MFMELSKLLLKIKKSNYLFVPERSLLFLLVSFLLLSQWQTNFVLVLRPYLLTNLWNSNKPRTYYVLCNLNSYFTICNNTTGRFQLTYIYTKTVYYKLLDTLGNWFLQPLGSVVVWEIPIHLTNRRETRVPSMEPKNRWENNIHCMLLIIWSNYKFF